MPSHSLQFHITKLPAGAVGRGTSGVSYACCILYGHDSVRSDSQVPHGGQVVGDPGVYGAHVLAGQVDILQHAVDLLDPAEIQPHRPPEQPRVLGADAGELSADHWQQPLCGCAGFRNEREYQGLDLIWHVAE